jgi:aspartate/methionine/tyrosine aminotransferase
LRRARTVHGCGGTLAHAIAAIVRIAAARRPPARIDRHVAGKESDKMVLKVSKRRGIDPFIALDVLRRANEREIDGEDVLHLEIGQPAGGAPSGVIRRAQEALQRHRLGYTEALGLPELRRLVALHYQERYAIAVDWRRIAITTGSSGAFLLAFLAGFDIGDRVVLPDPGYPAYRNILGSLGITPVHLPTRVEDRFQPTVALLESLPGPLDGLIVAHPSNPAGTMPGPDDLRDLTHYCRDRGMRLISDEIYHGITYGRDAVTALAFDDQAIVINSFSKYFSMTGWRLGWAVLPESLARTVECLAQSLFISPPTLSQIAALGAFDCRTELDANVARYRRNRDLLLARLPQAGLTRFVPPEGAFYLYADVSSLSDDSEELCRRLLAETGVALTPGVDFDRERGHAFLRISFAGAERDIARALDRLVEWRSRRR